jgi:hypothetical protein
MGIPDFEKVVSISNAPYESTGRYKGQVTFRTGLTKKRMNLIIFN